MRFSPKTEDDVRPSFLLKPGECDFTVVNAEDQTSTAGNDMIKLTLEVYDAEGRKAVIFDYLLESMAQKLRHFCYGTNQGQRYEQGDLTAADCDGKSGRCIVRTEKDKTGEYPDKNKIADYVAAPRPAPARQPTSPTSANGNGHAAPPSAAQIAKREAWEAWKHTNAGLSTAELQETFGASVKAYFKGKPPEIIEPREWKQYVADGFVRRQVESPLEPAGAAFKDDDIPF